jgi:hypothetical protein
MPLTDKEVHDAAQTFMERDDTRFCLIVLDVSDDRCGCRYCNHRIISNIAEKDLDAVLKNSFETLKDGKQTDGGKE